MNNPANMYNSSNQQGSVNDPQASNSDLQQLSSTQSDYINQFVGSTPQSSYPQSANQMMSQQQMNSQAQQPPVNLSLNQSVTPTQQTTPPVVDAVGQNFSGYSNNPVQNASQSFANQQIQSPELSNDLSNQELVNNQPLNTPQIPVNDAFSLPQSNNSFEKAQTEIDNQFGNNYPTNDLPALQNQPYVSSEPQSGLSTDSMNSTPGLSTEANQPYGTSVAQGNMMQQQYNPVVPQNYAPPVSQFNQPVQNTLQGTPVNIEPQVVGAQQVEINQDYAEKNTNNQWLNSPLTPAIQNQSNTQLNPQQYNPTYQSPTNLTVDHDFSDGNSLGDDSQVSTGFLPAFDDNSDDSMLPVASDDNDDVFGNLDEPDATLPFGFSDYDPNEQVSSSLDSLSGFESQSLEEEANRIDVDFSESMPTNSQTVGVLTQEPQTQTPQNVVPTRTLSDVSYTAPAPTTLNQVEPQAQQAPMPVDSELSPTARLNKLLEEEEQAEKVIMQKQEQSVMKVAKSPKTVDAKSNIFKQTSDDVAFQGDIRNELSAKKPTSRYFMIISLIIIISVIGFLLVLLGLTLL